MFNTRIDEYSLGKGFNSTVVYMCREAATTEDDTGIAGILNRLEKQRNLTLGFTLREKEDSADDVSSFNLL